MVVAVVVAVAVEAGLHRQPQRDRPSQEAVPHSHRDSEWAVPWAEPVGEEEVLLKEVLHTDWGSEGRPAS